MTYSNAGRYGPEAVLCDSGSGNPTLLRSTAVTVKTSAGVVATLYTDRTAATTAANPVNTDTGGNLTFFAMPGQYALNYTAPGGPVSLGITVNLDPADTSPDVFASATYLSPIGRTASKTAVLAKPSGDGADGVIDWVSEDTAGYLLHLTSSGATWAGGLIGLGVDAGVGAGLVVSVKTSNNGGGGIYLDNQATVSGATSFGMKGSQKSTAAPLVKLEQALGGVAPALVLQPLVAGTGQILMQMLGTSGTPFWWIRADTGEQVMTTPLNTTGQVHTTYATGNVAGGYLQTSASTYESSLRMYRDTGASTFYAWQLRTNVDALQLTSNGAATGTDGTETAHVVMSFKDNKVGLYGGAPVIQAAAITAPNTQTASYVQADVQSIVTAVNAIRAALTGIGVTL